MAGPTTAQRGAEKSAPSGPPPAAPRVRIRLPRPRRPRRRTVVVALIATALLGGAAGWALYGSQWFRVERVTASGTRVLTPHQVAGRADVPLKAPLASVDTEAVAARLRAELPRIASVDVVRSWPNGIDLKVTERTPEVLLETDGKFVEVDAGGVRFARVEQRPKGVPLLKSEAGQSPGSRRFGAGRLQREAVRVAAGLPGTIQRDTRVIRVRSYDSITLELTGGRTVVWGSSEQGDVKAQALLALMKIARGARHFDVSAPTAPAMKGS
ncbi:FtsQ-type POTRA domain-containing protein [Streptomyces sp. NPDC004647]|uniref:cell division protein FtsQ/DivIB n=1 Tax=Streptomyces sp. NPDC004647 TaxID=3154671 RepID=UPI0033A199C0